jgi:hypothetical protein
VYLCLFVDWTHSDRYRQLSLSDIDSSARFPYGRNSDHLASFLLGASSQRFRLQFASRALGRHSWVHIRRPDQFENRVDSPVERAASAQLQARLSYISPRATAGIFMLVGGPPGHAWFEN